MKRVRLGEVCTIVSGTTPRSDNSAYWGGTINWVTPAELTDEKPIVFETQRKITEKAVRATGLKMFPAGTVLLSSRAPIGKVAIAGVEMCCNQGFKNLICSKQVYNMYLFQLLKSKTNYLNSLGRGATFKELSKGIVEEIEIELPSLPEQRHIAVVLDRIDSLIANYRRQLNLLDTLAQSRFHELFGDAVTNTKKWPLRKLPDIAEYHNGLNYKPNDVSPEGTVVLRAGNIQGQELVLNDVVRVKCPIKGRYFVKENDILMCACNGSAQLVGKSTLIPSLSETMSFGSFMKIIRTPFHEYLQAFFQTPAFRRQIQTAKTTTINQITNQMMDLIELPLPPSSLLEDFNKQTTKIKAQKESIRTSLRVAETLKAAMTQKFFKIRPNWETA